MFRKSSNLTKSFEGLRIEIETPVDFDTVRKRSHDLTGRTSVNEVISVTAQVKSAADLVSRAAIPNVPGLAEATPMTDSGAMKKPPAQRGGAFF